MNPFTTANADALIDDTINPRDTENEEVIGYTIFCASRESNVIHCCQMPMLEAYLKRWTIRIGLDGLGV